VLGPDGCLVAFIPRGFKFHSPTRERARRFVPHSSRGPRPKRPIVRESCF